MQISKKYLIVGGQLSLDLYVLCIGGGVKKLTARFTIDKGPESVQA